MKDILKDLNFTYPSNGNAPEYSSITEATEYREAVTYYLNTTKENENLMKGKGISEMQGKIAYVFKVFYPSIFKEFFENQENKDGVTSGIYGPKTMNLVMEFQQKYMKKHFEEINWDPLKGYGSFGGNTKNILERFFKSAKYEVKRSNTKDLNAIDIDDAYRSMGSGY